MESDAWLNSGANMPIVLGKDISGQPVVLDLAKAPHLLIAGQTGSGKSVCMNTLIMSLLFTFSPDDLRLIMVDPKVVEFKDYEKIPHLITPILNDYKKVPLALRWAVNEMERRYRLIADAGVKDVKDFNKRPIIEGEVDRNGEPMPRKLPYIVIIIDELADLMQTASKEVEDSIARIAAKARAAGMHMILATQRPSVDVITGVIKANIPTRIALTCSSQIDSRTIIDSAGAEKLLGRGDMLFDPVGATKPNRLQGCFVSNEEIKSVVDFIKGDRPANYDDDVMFEIERQAAIDKKQKTGLAEDGPSDDPMIKEAIRVVVENGQASTSLLQRKLKLGYARAARIVDEMEARGVVGPYEGSKPRKVLITPEQLMEMELSSDE
jgi:S-DNA-T family DNA segregation ATPase FtsK/SpoIIIE